MKISTSRFPAFVIKAPVMAALFLPLCAGAAGPGHRPPAVETLANILSLVIVMGVVKVGGLAILTGVQTLRPAAVRSGRIPLRTTPVRIFFVGLFTMIGAMLLLGIAQGLSGPLGVGLALAVLAALLWWILNGLAAVCTELGERFQAGIGGLRVGSETAALLLGGILFMATGFLPVVGQIIEFTALLCALGIGMTQSLDRTSTRIRSKKKRPESTEIPSETTPHQQQPSPHENPADPTCMPA